MSSSEEHSEDCCLTCHSDLQSLLVVTAATHKMVAEVYEFFVAMGSNPMMQQMFGMSPSAQTPPGVTAAKLGGPPNPFARTPRGR